MKARVSAVVPVLAPALWHRDFSILFLAPWGWRVGVEHPWAPYKSPGSAHTWFQRPNLLSTPSPEWRAVPQWSQQAGFGLAVAPPSWDHADKLFSSAPPPDPLTDCSHLVSSREAIAQGQSEWRVLFTRAQSWRLCIRPTRWAFGLGLGAFGAAVTEY